MAASQPQEPAASAEPLVPTAEFARIALPIPLPPLTYRIPEGASARVGMRVRAHVGKRALVGFVVGLEDEAPKGFRIRDFDEVLDLEPVIPSDLLSLAQFVSDYYLAPLGEVLRVMVPSDLPPWGDRRISLTDAGALAPPADELESRIKTYLMAHRRVRLAELQRHLASHESARRLAELARQGRVAVEEPGRRGGTRFVKAVELSSGDFDEHLAACGRSAKGRAVLQFLQQLERPATLREVTSEVGCGSGVVRRLVQLGVLREFTQPQRISLQRHRMGGKEEAAPFELRPDQATSVAALNAALKAGEYSPFLLHGITGSGKTEVYLRAVRTCLDEHRCAVLMVPEIALVPALGGELRQRFGSELAILHSNLSTSERQQEWERIRRGEARVILGPRSALWAPVEPLGLVVVDEEHDGSYKQDQTPRYNGRDLALLRARNAGATVLLVSATPSLESRYNCEHGKLTKLDLRGRIGSAGLPEGILVDLRKEPDAMLPEQAYFTGRLIQEVSAALERDEQVILMRNRRGYAPVLLCRSCGEDFRCEDCGLSMTFHLRGHRLSCHYCGQEQQAPRSCPACGDAALEPMGAGTERVEERFRELFAGVPVAVLDADSSRRRGGAAIVLDSFAKGKSRVLIGTQMVSKGHHFPRVSLAAVLFADTYLKFPDFRAVEKTYALLTQLAGRAGRGDRPGKVLIQTFQPEHYAIRAALDQHDAAFAGEEMQFRQTFMYPPFSRMVQVLSGHQDVAKAQQALIELRQHLLPKLDRRCRLFGPTAAPFEKLRGKWRFQLMLRGPSGQRLRQALAATLPELAAPLRGQLTIDVDPYDLL